jgi:O-acetyl-ADP-ribose deacetylase (regulator of RNase III)
MISYVQGDATRPNVVGTKIIAHVCNDIGAWERGFVLSLSQTYPGAERAYRSWYQQNDEYGMLPFKLGEVQLIKVSDDTYVANMIAQHGIFARNNVPPIRYDALERCLQTLRLSAGVLGTTVHMPRIGCGLAGGRWSEVAKLLDKHFSGVEVYVYDFNTGDDRTIHWNQ